MEFFFVFSNDFICLLPELFMVFCSAAILIFGALFTNFTLDSLPGRGPILVNSVLVLSILVLFLSSLLSFHGVFDHGSLFYGSLYFDPLTANVKGITYLASGLCLFMAGPYLFREGIYAFEYPFLVLMSTLGMVLVLSSYNLLALYLALELQSLCFYVLASFKRGSAYSTEAGLKYFIVGAFSSGLLLFGISLIYAYTGTVGFEDLGRLLLGFDFLANAGGVCVGLFFLSAGLLFKVSAAPFHMWAPDVYEGSPTCSALFFSSVPKFALFVACLRLYYVGFYDASSFWQDMLLGFSLLSLVVAAISTLYQRKVKRFLAFSSISHVGFLLIGLGVGTLEGLQSLLLYLVVYTVMALTSWSVLMFLLRRKDYEGHKTSFKYLDELYCLPLLNPALGGTLLVLMFSMGGVPPLAGFFVKMQVILSALEASFYLIAVVSILTSVIAAFYYLRWLKLMYFETSKLAIFKGTFLYDIHISRGSSLILATASLFLVFFIAVPGPLLVWSHFIALSVALSLIFFNQKSYSCFIIVALICGSGLRAKILFQKYLIYFLILSKYVAKLQSFLRWRCLDLYISLRKESW